METQVLEHSSEISRYIDTHAREHLERLKEIVGIPSIAAENPEGAGSFVSLMKA